MEKTEEAIQEFMKKMNDWGLTKSLSPNEKRGIEQDLRNIASTAIAEIKTDVNNVLFEMYNKVYHKKDE